MTKVKGQSDQYDGQRQRRAVVDAVGDGKEDELSNGKGQDEGRGGGSLQALRSLRLINWTLYA